MAKLAACWGLLRWPFILLRAIIILSINAYAVGAYIGWLILLLPLRWAVPDVYWGLEKKLFATLQAMVAQWLWSAGYIVADVGEDISRYADEECLLLVNHQSTGDVPVMMTCLQDKGDVAGSVLWIIDYLFKYTHFGVCSMLRGDCFIATGKTGRDEQRLELQTHIEDRFWPRGRKWIILFPEGGFLRKRKTRSQAFAKKNDYPYLEHCSLPRLGALQAILDVLSPCCTVTNDHRKVALKWVVDVTIGYPDGRPLDIITLLTGSRAGCQTDVHCRVYPADTLPVQLPALRDWLFARYVEKDELLSQFYSTGRFPPPLPAPRRYGPAFSEPTPVEFSVVTIAAQQAFFLGSLWLQYFIVSGCCAMVQHLF